MGLNQRVFYCNRTNVAHGQHENRYNYPPFPAKELKRAKPRLTRATVTKLQNYDWPGNVRDCATSSSAPLSWHGGGALDFDLPITGQAQPGCSTGFSGGFFGWQPALSPSSSRKPSFNAAKRDNLLLVLEAANWKISGRDSAAELMGVKPTTLLSRMAKWGLKKPEREPS